MIFIFFLNTVKCDTEKTIEVVNILKFSFFFIFTRTQTVFVSFFLWFQRCGKWSLIWCKLSNAPKILVFNIIFFFFSVIVHFINEVKKNSRDLWKIIYVQTHAQWPIILGHSKHLSIVGFVAYFFLSLKILFLFYLLDGNDWNMFFFYFKIKQIHRKRWYYFLK